ncbi:MAG: hypothetical protein NUW01_07165 [Gemmatimonadaceae bacterium]|nr:hypothetical protein [Gemmatimonadaceae bacterium]
MSRETFVWVEGRGVIPKSEAPPPEIKRGHHIIKDFTEPVLCPADGQRYGSKRAYERAVRAAGCEIVGNESLSRVEQNKPKLTRPGADIARAIEALSR